MIVPILRKIDDLEINELSKFFIENDYFIIKNIISKEDCKYLNDNLIYSDNMRHEPTQFFREHNYDLVIENIHDQVTNILQKISKIKKYYRTYNFGMLYNKNSELLPHLDLITNELSSTLCFNSKENYPIYIDKTFIENKYNSRFTIEREKILDENIIKMEINVGDIGFFNGRNHYHFRDKLTKDIDYKGLLLHWSTCVYMKTRDEEHYPDKYQILDQQYYDEHIKNEVEFKNSVDGPIYIDSKKNI